MLFNISLINKSLKTLSNVKYKLLIIKAILVKAKNRTVLQLICWSNHLDPSAIYFRTTLNDATKLGTNFMSKNYYLEEKHEKPISNTYGIIAIELGTT